MRAHLETVTVELTDPVRPDQARDAFRKTPGLRVLDNARAGEFPTSRAASHQDQILVGRIRHDPSIPDRRGVQFICAADQLRKGAALNAVQIAERILHRAPAH